MGRAHRDCTGDRNVSQRRKARVYGMSPNVPRILDAILFVIAKGQERGVILSQYDIVKAIFLADRAHLNRFGRPITYDNYVAMKFGPVPSLVYDLLKENQHAMHRHKIDRLPWERRDLGDGKAFSYRAPERVPNDETLSPSDLEELSDALTVVKSLGFGQIKRLTHEDKAYIDAWEDEGDRSQYPMSYTLLFDVPNEDRAAELSFLSEHV